MPFLTRESIVGRFAKKFRNLLFTWDFGIETSVESLRSSLLLPPAEKITITVNEVANIADYGTYDKKEGDKYVANKIDKLK